MASPAPLIEDTTRYFVTADDILKPSEPRERFRKHFLSVYVPPSTHLHARSTDIFLFHSPIEEHGRQWSSLWDEGNFLPWDKLCASPALEDLMKASATLPIFQAHKAKRALVPGCGRGYDAWLFAQHGYETVGVEISGSAVREANNWVKQQKKNVTPATTAECEFILADFFVDEWLKVLGIPPKGGFELVYDYAVSDCRLLIAGWLVLILGL